MAKPNPPIWTRHLSKGDLHDLIARVKNGDQLAIDKAIDFIVADSLGMWHNRARAKLCRHFKNATPDKEQQRRLVDRIKSRLINGDFHEQFKDQLGMATNFAPRELQQAANSALENEKRYIRKYAKWVLTRIENSISGKIAR